MLFIFSIHIDCMVDGAGESGDNASFAIKDAVEPSAPLIIAARFTPPIVKRMRRRRVVVEWGELAKCTGVHIRVLIRVQMTYIWVQMSIFVSKLCPHISWGDLGLLSPRN